MRMGHGGAEDSGGTEMGLIYATGKTEMDQIGGGNSGRRAHCTRNGVLRRHWRKRGVEFRRGEGRDKEFQIDNL